MENGSSPKKEIEGGSGPGSGPDSSNKLLDLRGIVKRFPGIVALDKVDFDLCEGEVHVLFGENGSGKSTLVNVVAGSYVRDEGEMIYQGSRLHHNLNPQEARAMGISPVFQEFSLVPDLTVEENLFLGRERTFLGVLQKAEMLRQGQKVLQELGFNLKARTRVGSLTRADQQMTEIAKALLQNVKLLILDEPTASLTERETVKLFQIIARLKSKGVGVIYVSHRLAEIREIGDRVTVLRDGKRIGTVLPSMVSDIQLVEMMTGRHIDVLFPKIEFSPGEPILETRDLSVDGCLQNIDITLRSGEIVGIAGLAGGGKSEIARAIFGLQKISGGHVLMNGEVIRNPKPSTMLKKGVVYFPSDRAAEGLALSRPVRENVSMASLDLPVFRTGMVLRRRNERRAVKRIVEKLRVRPPLIERAVKFFSGGNQQKVVLLRGLSRESKVFLFDDPTVGIDVGAKTDVYLLLKSLAESGAAVLFISSELPEILNLSNRVYVAHNGRIVVELAKPQITERNILMSFFEQEEEIQKATRAPVQGP